MQKLSSLVIIGFTAITLLGGCSTYSADADVPKGYIAESFDVKGMYCPSCAISMQEYLKSMEGVADAEVSYLKKEGRIVYDPAKIKRDAFIEIAVPYELIFAN